MFAFQVSEASFCCQGYRKIGSISALRVIVAITLTIAIMSLFVVYLSPVNPIALPLKDVFAQENNPSPLSSPSPSSSSASSSNILMSEQPRQYNQSQPIRVLILTYMRSGSSLTGDILQQIPQAFYNYEPLKPFESGSGNDVIRRWFQCDLLNLPRRALMDSKFLDFGLKTREFPACYHGYQHRAEDERTAYTHCTQNLRRSCLVSPVRIIKTIRLPMKDVESLLRIFPDLKVIHLLRDPRGTMISMTKKLTSRVVENRAVVYCRKRRQDTHERKRLSKLFPDRLLTLQYEDLALNPIETAKVLYKFVGGIFTPNAERYIHSITSAGKTDTCRICTTRANSSEHIDLWKKVNTKYINIIQDKCRDILRRENYVWFHSK